MGSESEK
jgi:MFS transporter, Spinster family, sphingosine-1-phosphate transporter